MTLNKINFNSDLAEQDLQFYKKVDKPLISNINSANICCLYHGGSEEVIKEAISECMKKDVSIGAHISFLDRENFGRSQVEWNERIILDLLEKQMNILLKICKTQNAIITHFKPHGALSNISSNNPRLAEIIISYFKSKYPKIIILAPALSELANASKKAGLKTILEIFADRTYENDGTLTPRILNGSLITCVQDVVTNVRTMIEKKAIISRLNLKIPTQFDSICLHSDTPNSVEISKEICILLKSMKIKQKKLTDFF